MNPELNEIVSPRNLRKSPVRSSGIPPPGSSRLQQSIALRPPSGATGLRPPSTSGIKPPGQHAASATLPPPSRAANQSGIRPPSQSRPTGLRPPTITLQPATPRVIPIPGEPTKLGAIPKATRPPSGIRPPSGKARVVVPVARSASTTSLLPKPSFLQVPSAKKTVPSSRLPPPQTPKTPATRAAVTLPRTAVKKRVTSADPTAEKYNIAGRDVEFVEYVPSPAERPYVPWTPTHHPLVLESFRTPRPEKTPQRQREVVFESAAELEILEERAPKKYQFPDEPTVINAKEFQAKLRADLERSRKMVADMEALYEQKAAALARLKARMEEQERSPEAPEKLDVDAFREKYGITQSPKMRQLLEVTGRWNQEILEQRQFDERVAAAGSFAKKERIRRVPGLEMVREVDDEDPAVEEARQLQFEQNRQMKIDEYKNHMKSQEEYRRLMEERKQNTASRRPYAKQEREEIRKQYQVAQEWTYTTPTEKELDNALKMAEMMELKETGVSLHSSPDKTVSVLFPEAAPTAEITGVACDVLIPAEISVEKLNTINSLDRGTIEVALQASLVPTPTEDAAKNILETG